MYAGKAPEVQNTRIFKEWKVDLNFILEASCSGWDGCSEVILGVVVSLTTGSKYLFLLLEVRGRIRILTRSSPNSHMWTVRLVYWFLLLLLSTLVVHCNLNNCWVI